MQGSGHYSPNPNKLQLTDRRLQPNGGHANAQQVDGVVAVQGAAQPVDIHSIACGSVGVGKCGEVSVWGGVTADMGSVGQPVDVHSIACESLGVGKL